MIYLFIECINNDLFVFLIFPNPCRSENLLEVAPGWGRVSEESPLIISVPFLVILTLDAEAARLVADCRA